MPSRRTAKPSAEPNPKEVQPVTIRAMEFDSKLSRQVEIPPLPPDFDVSKLKRKPNIELRHVKLKSQPRPPAPSDAETRTAATIESAVQEILNDLGLFDRLQGLSGLTPAEKESKYFEALASLRPGQYDRAFNRARDGVGYSQSRFDALLDEYKRRIHDILNAELSGTLAQPSPTIEAPDTQTPVPRMVEDDRIITKEGIRYFPISLAAQESHVPRTTLVDWIKAKTKFNGQPLKIYNSPTAKKLYLSEESLERIANRFLKWPSHEPAGAVTVGETKDKSGYIGISKAARSVGVDHHTMWLWSAHGTAPTDRPLDIIKCTATEQFYIREKDILLLKKFIPRSGLRRGPRSRQPAPS
jgi:hypothetical protein